VDLVAAKAVALESELARRGAKLKRLGRELIGPCPACGGTDRFAVNVHNQIWNCRGCAMGGDVIELVRHLDGCDFVAAVDTLTGGQRPVSAPSATPKISDGDHERRQREKATWLWSRREPITGTIAERYLRAACG
jgi:DNA primase